MNSIERPVSVPLLNNSDVSEIESTPDLSNRSTPMPPLSSRDDNTAFSDDSDDELQDWSLLNSFSKRGMKDFEPLLTDTDKSTMSAYDQSKLNKARNMRFAALAVKRGTIVNLENLNSSTIFISIQDHSRIFMLQPKGKFLETMGFIDNQNVCHFGYEEALYLVERGSCLLKFYDTVDKSKNEIYAKMPPLSLQTAYGLLAYNEERLNRYLVYSILKRDGYIVRRNEEFDGIVSSYKQQINENVFGNLEMSWWTKLLARVSSFLKMDFPFKLALSYYNIFTYLRSKIKPQSVVKPTCKPSNKYLISFNVWKPSPSFKKKNPPLPDYQLVILKASETLPKYAEIKSLLERAKSNPDTNKPKPKKGKLTRLETEHDYSKGIDINNLKYDPHRITFAIVDNVTVNFITLSNCSFVKEGPVWRDHWVTWKPPSKKKSKPRRFVSKEMKTEATITKSDEKNGILKVPATAHF
ncbi:hypothetical protein CANINC_004842 [Pichia inconspicua]|uniref:tRNA-splicing endonuclease subunit Sen54 N-terminal domain-containing protein n=1 Tax=Pichia inconspicua TaxID=52247 RepID=A0A4T0WV29_9ASCO|nr:hypothetical protein CANINC_004842 [[Candida] inconspicua]